VRVCVCVSYEVLSGVVSGKVSEVVSGSVSVEGWYDAPKSPPFYYNTSDVSSLSRRHLVRSTSDKSPRCTAKHQRSNDDRSPASTPTQWPVAGHRATLPRAGKDSLVSRDADRTTVDVWQPMNDDDVFISQHQTSNSFQRAVHVGATSERSSQRKTPIQSPTTEKHTSVDDQCAVWAGSESSPWETSSSMTQSASRQISVQTQGGASGEQLNNYTKLDCCNSLTQPAHTPVTLSRSWFDIDRPQTQPTSLMSSSAVGLASLHADIFRGGTITETKTVCSICSSEAFITEMQLKTDAVRSDDQQLGAIRDRGYRGGAGGSLPRCYGQRTAEQLGVPGSTNSMPRTTPLFTATSAVMMSGAATATSSSSCEHATSLLSTSAAAAGNDVRTLMCPSPKRSLSSRDDECKRAPISVLYSTRFICQIVASCLFQQNTMVIWCS